MPPAGTMQLLPPVGEALNLLDVSLVKDDWQGAASLRRTIQILVDHIHVQGVQLSRVEDILASYGSQQGGTVWSKLAGKADLSRCEALEQQVDQMANDAITAKMKQDVGAGATEELAARVEQLREQVCSVEARLGVAAPDGSTGHSKYTPIGHHGGGGGDIRRDARRVLSHLPRSGGADSGASGGAAARGTALERIARLEGRVERVGETSSQAEDGVTEVLSRLRDLEPRVEVQLSHLRTDIKQALALAAASSKAEAEGEATARVKEAEKRTVGRLRSLEEQLEGRVSAMSGQLGALLNGELDKRFQSLYDHVQAQGTDLRGELERLARDKVDHPSIEQYIARISGLFEQVASNLANDTREVGEQAAQGLAALRAELESLDNGKADKSLEETVRRELEGTRALALQVRDVMGVVNDSLNTAPRAIEETRAQLRQVAVDIESAQRSISGLNSAMSSTTSALELQAQKGSQMAHRLGHVSSDLTATRHALFGHAMAGSGGGDDAGEHQPSIADSSAVLPRLVALERGSQEALGVVASKADDAALREHDRRLAALQRQVDTNSEGVRTLGSTTYKRVDEHASAIQRLTMAISSNLDERPTLAAVKTLVAGQVGDVHDACDAALVPVWEAVRLMQSGLREAAGQAKALTIEVAEVQQSQEEARTRGGLDKAALVGVVRRAVDQDLGDLRAALEERLSGADDSLRGLRVQLDALAQVQQQTAMAAGAVETRMLAAACGATAALRGEVLTRLDGASTGLSDRIEALDIACRHTTQELAQLRTTTSGLVTPDETQALVHTVARAAAKAEVSHQAERENQRWQLWFAQFGESLESLVTRPELETLLLASTQQLLSDCDARIEPGLAQLRSKIAALRSEAEASRRGAESRLQATETRMQAAERAAAAAERTAATAADRQDVVDVARLLEHKVDLTRLDALHHEVNARLDGLRREGADLLAQHAGHAVTRSDLDSELAKKLDIRTFLAASSANAAAATAGALASLSSVSASPPRRGAAASAASPLRPHLGGEPRGAYHGGSGGGAAPTGGGNSSGSSGMDRGQVLDRLAADIIRNSAPGSATAAAVARAADNLKLRRFEDAAR